MLRKNMTDVEKLLWKHLRQKQLNGFKFRKQSPIGPYVADFVSFDRKLIIELDGGQHASQNTYDSKRDKWFQSQRFKTLRFWNNEVLQNLEGIKTVILKSLSPHLVPPPQGGRTAWPSCDRPPVRAVPISTGSPRSEAERAVPSHSHGTAWFGAGRALGQAVPSHPHGKMKTEPISHF